MGGPFLLGGAARPDCEDCAVFGLFYYTVFAISKSVRKSAVFEAESYTISALFGKVYEKVYEKP